MGMQMILKTLVLDEVTEKVRVKKRTSGRIIPQNNYGLHVCVETPIPNVMV